MDRERLALRAHELGMHDDYWFHEECLTCIEQALDGYLRECNEILRIIGKDGAAFSTHIRELPHDSLVWILHDAPMYVIADFLGIHDQATDSEFQIIQQVADSIRSRFSR